MTTTGVRSQHRALLLTWLSAPRQVWAPSFNPNITQITDKPPAQCSQLILGAGPSGVVTRRPPLALGPPGGAGGRDVLADLLEELRRLCEVAAHLAALLLALLGLLEAARADEALPLGFRKVALDLG